MLDLTSRSISVLTTLEGLLLGTHQGAVSAKHLPTYFHEFRFNRRRSSSRAKLVHRLAEIAVVTAPKTYRDIVNTTIIAVAASTWEIAMDEGYAIDPATERTGYPHCVEGGLREDALDCLLDGLGVHVRDRGEGFGWRQHPAAVPTFTKEDPDTSIVTARMMQNQVEK